MNDITRIRQYILEESSLGHVTEKDKAEGREILECLDRVEAENKAVKKGWKDCVLENIAHEESLEVTNGMYADAKAKLTSCQEEVARLKDNDQ